MEISKNGIPILDYSPAINGSSGAELTTLAKHVADACESIGCYYIKNHGVDQQLIDDTFRDLNAFFTKPLDYKLKYRRNEKHWLESGYYPFESQNTYLYLGYKDGPNDQIEMLTFGPTNRKYPTPPNFYPDYPATLKENVDKYYDSLFHVGMTMMRVLSIAAKAPDDEYFVRKMQDGPHTLKTNFYPEYSKPNSAIDGRLPTHTDLAPLAIVANDDTPNSLRVKNAKGEWVFADPIPGALFVNLGRPLQRWTNDKWVATEHGVVWPENGLLHDRLSLAFFVSMEPEAVIECLPSCKVNGEAKHPPITFNDLYKGPMQGLLN